MEALLKQIEELREELKKEKEHSLTHERRDRAVRKPGVWGRR